MVAGVRPRVIVADDHPRILDRAATILNRNFDVVAVVSNGQAAIDASARFEPDVVVLDIVMPGLDGFQTASRITASGLSPRIVFLSSHDSDDYVLASLSQGGTAFVPKLRMERDLTAAVDHAYADRAFIPSAGVLPRWLRPAAKRHDLQLYATDEFLINAVASFFINALEMGDSVIAVADESHRRGIATALGMRGIDLAALADADRYSEADAASTLDALLVNGVPDRDRWAALFEPVFDRAIAASIGAPRHVTVFGEIAPILHRRHEFDAMRRLERIAGEFSASRPFSVLCGYSIRAFSEHAGSVLASLCAEHSVIVPGDPDFESAFDQNID